MKPDNFSKIMGHHHDHGHNARKNITFAFFLNLFFSFVELIGGIYTNSIAIMSDALHDFSDAISLGVAWYLQKYSEKERDDKYSYGYKRFSLLGSLFISSILLAGSIIVIKESVTRLFSPQEANAEGMLYLAILGIIVNGAAVFKLKKGTTLNERAVFLHLMEDVLGWVAVLIVSIVMMFVNLPILDPLLSIAISIWILTNIYKNFKATFSILLQHTPDEINVSLLEEKITGLKEIQSIHDLHIWSLDGQKNIMSLHVVLKDDLTLTELSPLKEQIREICTEMDIEHVTIEFEAENENCSYEQLHA